MRPCIWAWKLGQERAHHPPCPPADHYPKKSKRRQSTRTKLVGGHKAVRVSTSQESIRAASTSLTARLILLSWITQILVQRSPACRSWRVKHAVLCARSLSLILALLCHSPPHLRLLQVLIPPSQIQAVYRLGPTLLSFSMRFPLDHC